MFVKFQKFKPVMNIANSSLCVLTRMQFSSKCGLDLLIQSFKILENMVVAFSSTPLLSSLSTGVSFSSCVKGTPAYCSKDSSHEILSIILPPLIEIQHSTASVCVRSLGVFCPRVALQKPVLPSSFSYILLSFNPQPMTKPPAGWHVVFSQ